MPSACLITLSTVIWRSPPIWAYANRTPPSSSTRSMRCASQQTRRSWWATRCARISSGRSAWASSASGTQARLAQAYRGAARRFRCQHRRRYERGCQSAPGAHPGGTGGRRGGSRAPAGRAYHRRRLRTRPGQQPRWAVRSLYARHHYARSGHRTHRRFTEYLLRGWKTVTPHLRKLLFETLYKNRYLYRFASTVPFAGQWRVWQRQVLPRNVGHDVLELGCGLGDLLADMLAAGYHCRAVEQSPEMVAAARETLRRRGVGNEA